MIFYYEHEGTTSGELKVLFIISEIVLNYETVLIELRTTRRRPSSLGCPECSRKKRADWKT